MKGELQVQRLSCVLPPSSLPVVLCTGREVPSIIIFNNLRKKEADSGRQEVKGGKEKVVNDIGIRNFQLLADYVRRASFDHWLF